MEEVNIAYWATRETEGEGYEVPYQSSMENIWAAAKDYFDSKRWS